MLARRADYQIGIREVMREQMGLQSFFVDGRRRDATRHEALDRGQDLLTPAVVESERQDQAVVAPRSFDRREDGSLKLPVQAFQTADVTQLCPLPVQFIGFAFDYSREDAQNSVDLLSGPAPVVRRESPESEVLDANLRSRGCYTPNIIGSVLMARDPW